MGQIKAKTQLERLGFKDVDKKNPKHDEIQIWAYENAEKILRDTILAEKEFELKNRKWERQIIQGARNSEYKRVVGFIDLEFKYNAEYYNKIGDYNELETRSLFVEVKTVIPNLGELMRQMNFYRSFLTEYGSKFMVICPDDRYKRIINEQGIWFYKYKDPNLLF